MKTLQDEHNEWASCFGQALVGVLQQDYSKIKELASIMKLEWKTDGSPRLMSFVGGDSGERV